MKRITFIAIGVMLFSCADEKDAVADNTPKKEVEKTAVEPIENKEQFSFETFETENGWGYTILSNGKAYIRQENIPSVQGVNGFENTENAQKCAEFIIYKLENGIMPPSVTKAELDSVGVM